jgi:hypothetical protein|tara:strand:+ start:1135 stop:1308 length:174 start_codon:yes stop_codon:yes gene_type:complete
MNNITLAKYRNDGNGNRICIECIINGVHWTVPLKVGNMEYDILMKWVAEGNTIEEAD